MGILQRADVLEGSQVSEARSNAGASACFPEPHHTHSPRTPAVDARSGASGVLPTATRCAPLALEVLAPGTAGITMLRFVSAQS